MMLIILLFIFKVCTYIRDDPRGQRDSGLRAWALEQISRT